MEDDDQVLTNVDYCCKSSAFPKTYQEAMDSPKSSNWKAAMEEQMNSLTEKHTFTLSGLPVPLVLKHSKLGLLPRVTAK